MRIICTKNIVVLAILIWFTIPVLLAQSETWQKVLAENEPLERHENAFVKSGGKFYLLGGRGIKPVEIFDPATNTWSEGKAIPIEISHFQAVAYNGLIYVMGGLTGSWPCETPISHIYLYDPLLDLWSVGPAIPANRQRGAAGVAVYNDKIYLVCGIVNGHTSGWVPWLDEFDPATNTWKKLGDAPRARDHFQAAVANDKIVVAGGRKSGFEGKGFEATIPEVDIYDLKTGKWSTLPSSGNIPTQRAGCTATVLGDEVVVIGGESGSQEKAHSEVEALNVASGTWHKLPSLQRGRHGTQVIEQEGTLYIAAGCGNRGGSPELNSFEQYGTGQESPGENATVTRGVLQASIESHDFGKTAPGKSKTVSIDLNYKDGNQGIPLAYAVVTGSNEYTVDFPYSLPIILTPEKKISFDVTFKPTGNSKSTATLLIKPVGDGKEKPISITLSGN